jgi:phage tail protein X
MTLSGQVYTCVAGETFDVVALNVYGNEKYACDILNANPSLCTIPFFTGGEKLNLPIVEIPEVDEDEEYMPPDAPWKG